MSTPSPTPDDAGRPAWFPWAVGAGGAVAFAVALFLVVASLGPGGRAAATSTTDPGGTPGVTTTTSRGAGTTTTTATATTSGSDATTTTGSTTTTVAGPLIEDHFDDATTGVPLFGASANTYELTNGRGQLTGHVTGALPVTYPVRVGDVAISFQFRVTAGASDAARFGAIFFAEDPADGAIDPWVAAWVHPGAGEIEIQVFDGGFDATITASLPAAAGFDFNQWNTLEVTLDGGSVMVTLNGVDAIASGGPFPRSDGFVGFVMYAGADGDRMRIDDFVVEELG